MFAFLSLLFALFTVPAWALTINPTSVTVAVGANATTTVTGAGGTIRATSANTAIATASVSSNIVTVHGVAVGSTTVRISDGGRTQSRTLGVTVVAAANQPPSCTITSPATNVSISAGGSVNFAGTGTDPDNNTPLTYSWSFPGGAPSNSTAQNPGNVTYAAAGTFTATFTVRDSRNLACTTPATRTITVNPAPQVSLSINDVTVNEGAGNAVFSVSISAAPAQQVTVNFATANGTAQAPGDFVSTNGTLTFPAGSAASRTITVPINDDLLVEGTENFTVNLSGAVGATIARSIGTGTIIDNDQAPTRPNVSINSTSQSAASVPSAAVGEQSAPVSNNSNSTRLSDNVTLANGTGRNNFQVLAVNDLGMHCGDLDTRVASILPPFNVMHAQVVRKGSTGTSRPTKLGETDVFVQYSSATNINDPILTKADAIIDPAFAGVYKTNFWGVAGSAYQPFYPPGVLPPTYPVDHGLPVPDLETFYLTSPGTLNADTQDMPGRFFPYTQNPTQSFSQFVGTQPFFMNFPFGYTASVNWFEAAGVPITTFDDFGRENAYPLMRVQAVAKAGNTLGLAANTVLATVDAVVPVSGEADCKGCHADPTDPNYAPTRADVAQTIATKLGLSNLFDSGQDPQFGKVPRLVSVEWAADRNILLLHDRNHGTQLSSPVDAKTGQAASPVVCQACHYTPALDLAHLGPINDVLPDSAEQRKHKSMSAVMHGAHGATGVFPDMPPPSPTRVAQPILEQTCYMCHPGKRTQCLRGAMGQAGVVCQDCHGNMSQVGTDFSKNQPTGGFLLGGDFYTNPNTPRVPWANEPGCGSCHTGDAVSNLANSTGAVRNATDLHGNTDGIRLAQAYLTGDAKATPIVPTNKRFAENVITAGATTAPGANPKLFRVSTGHSGLFCEACHGSTHAEWSSSPTNPNANDNSTPTQLQGHPGAVIECGTCHTSLPNTLGGPHGMHPVGSSTSWANGGHENFVSGNNCVVCHGANATGSGRPQNVGTVLSRAAADRTLRGTLVPKGTPVGCRVCHGSGGGG